MKPPPRASRRVRAARTVETLVSFDKRGEVVADIPPPIGPRLFALFKLGLDAVEIVQNRAAKIAGQTQRAGARLLTVPAELCRRRQARHFARRDGRIASGVWPAKTQIGFVRNEHRDESDREYGSENHLMAFLACMREI